MLNFSFNPILHGGGGEEGKTPPTKKAGKIKTGSTENCFLFFFFGIINNKVSHMKDCKIILAEEFVPTEITYLSLTLSTPVIFPKQLTSA